MFSKEQKIGFYTTLVFHLLLLIIFLIYKIHNVVTSDFNFSVDFSSHEKLIEQVKQESAKEQAAKELNDILGSAPSPQSVRNVAVDRANGYSANDKSQNLSQDIYKESRDLQKRLDASKREALREEGSDEIVSKSGNDAKDVKGTPYKGPSVLSYSLNGRKGLYLPIPAYKCIGGGDVSIRIVVNRKGYVVDADVVKSASFADECICRYAIEAAKRSRFSASATAPERQVGEIVYRFIAQ